MKRWRFGLGQAGGAKWRRPKLGRKLTEREMEKCARCMATRWEHERQGIVRDHQFTGKDGPS